MRSKAEIKEQGKSVLKELRLLLLNTWYLLKSNFLIVLPFLIVYSVINILVTSMVVDLATFLALGATGQTYIGPDNAALIIRSPVTILLIFLALIAVCFLHIVEISGIMHAYSMSNIGKKTTLRGMISTGIHSGIRGFLPKNWVILPFIIVLIPLTGFFSLSFTSLQAVIPGFVREFIDANTLYHGLYLLLYFLMLVIELVCIFAMNFYLLSDASFPAACRRSQKLISGRVGFTLFFLVVTAILFSLLVTCVSASVSSLLLQLLSLFRKTLSATDSSRLAAWILTTNSFFGAILAPAVNNAALTTLFFQLVENKNMLASLSRSAFHDQVLTRPQLACVGAAAVLLLASNAVINIGDLAYPQPETLARPEIVAHRGDSVNAPENTTAAFELAAVEKPAWVELDVHQTKDGEIVVSHDDDLTRVSGRKLFVHDLTYDELQDLDVGSWFSDEYSYIRLAKLDDVLKLLKGKCNVMVEIKYTGFGDHVEERVLEIINSNGMHDETLIISTHPGTLARVKELDPTMITCYTMFLAWEHIEDIPYADWYTVEEGNVEIDLVNYVHAAGGRVYAWTVNDEAYVQYLIDCGVDGMLTDDPIMMKSCLDRAKYDTGLFRYLRIYLDTLREF